MRNISEVYANSHSVYERINESLLEESLKDKILSAYNSAKELLGKWADKIVQGAKNVFGKFGSYFVPVREDGGLLPTPGAYTMGLAYANGDIDRSNTFVKLDKEGERLTGTKTSLGSAIKMYGSGNSIDFWQQLVKEAEESGAANVNEVKLANDDPEAKYNIIVDGEGLKAEIKRHLNNRKLARLMIWGAPGIGKTAILQSVLDEFKEFQGYQLICKTLSNETPDNFTLPKYIDVELDVVNDKIAQIKKKIGEKFKSVVTRATDVPKTWMPVYKPCGDPEVDTASDEACGKGLLFIDELSRATPQVLNVILPLINEGQFNGYKLGSGWCIIVASNRPQDEEGGQTSIGNALSNRFAHVYFEPCVKSWRKWADTQNYMSPLLLQWLEMPETEEFSGGKFYYWDPNSAGDGTSEPSALMCTPRAWTNAMRDLAEFANTGSLEGFELLNIPENVLARALNKYIPATAIDQFLGFLTIIRRIGNFDQAVHDVWQNGGKGLNIAAKDLRKIAMPLAQLIICAHGGKNLPTEKEFNNLTDWLISTDNDQMVAYVYNIFQNVYADVLSDNLKEHIYSIKFTWERRNTEAEHATMESAYKPLLQKYGIKSCADFPDYRPAIKRIMEVPKFSHVFNNTTFDGKSALT